MGGQLVMLTGPAGDDRTPSPAHQHECTDERLLQVLAERLPWWQVKPSDDQSVWIGVERPYPPQHRIITAPSLRDLAVQLLGLAGL